MSIESQPRPLTPEEKNRRDRLRESLLRGEEDKKRRSGEQLHPDDADFLEKIEKIENVKEQQRNWMKCVRN